MDGLGFEVWYRQQHPRLVSSLVVIAAGDVATAADVADEAFARAYANWDRVGQMASPGGWTYRTAVNVLRRRFSVGAGRLRAQSRRVRRRSPDGRSRTG